MSQPALKASPAEHAFKRAHERVQGGRRLFEQLKLIAINAARDFRLADNLAEHGEMKALCKHYNYSDESVRTYIKFINALEQKAREIKPTLKGDALDRAVNEMVLTSPAGITQMMRDVGVLKQVGAYDAAAYQQKKLAGGPQLVFAFEHFESQVRALVQTEQVFELSRSSLLKLKDELEEARAKVEEALAGKTEEEPVHA